LAKQTVLLGSIFHIKLWALEMTASC